MQNTIATPAVWTGGISNIKKDLEQLHLAFALPSVSYFDPDYYASEVFSVLYGGGMSSRLFQEIREKRGLAYNISAFTTTYVDGGNFGVYAGTDANNAFEVIDASITEIEKLADSVTDAELVRAKAQMRSGLLMGLESPSGRTESLIRQQFIFNKFIDTDEMIAKISDVTADNIREFAIKLLRSGKAACCTLGDVDKITQDYSARLARFLPH